ncbi:MAG: hypothetical protein NTW21_35875, partial [Verrucomicrobia bacterium]|nr:hypothetical protein [Verrucomicrobiota bacterium]
MNRFTFMLGFALLVMAATLAVTITTRNAPGAARALARSGAGTPQTTQHPSHSQALPPGAPVDSTGQLPVRGQANDQPGVFRVALPETWLASLPAEQQAACHSRVAAVESDARVRLARLTAELDLTVAQREKMFPVLVRLAPGYDPAMLVGGTRPATPSALAAPEAMHQVLDPQQQALLEDQEVNRQLWWQDTLSRLEADLIETTGAAPT